MAISFPHTIRGIIFDLDGTLYKMKWFMKPLLTIMLSPRILLLPRYMSVRKSFAGKEMGNGDELLNAMAATLAEKSGRCTTESILSWIHNRFYSAFKKIMPFLKGSRPGLNDLLATLQERGFKLAIVSDFSHIEERLNGLCIPGSLFNTIISSETEGSLKPSCRALLVIAKSWQLPPSSILVIGDRDDTDGIAAARAGMPYIRISDKKSLSAGAHNWQAIHAYLNNLSSH